MRRISKKTGLVVAATALAAGGGGAAIAATQLDSPTERSDAIVSDAAKQLGIAPEKLSDALKKAVEDQIDADVAAGRLTKERGDALKAAIDAGRAPLLGRVPFGPGPVRAGFVIDLDAAAGFPGLTQAELREQLRSGKSLAAVAGDRGKSVDGLVSALVDAAKKHLDDAVSAGRLTREQEQAIEANLRQRITDVVNRTRPAPGPGFRGFRDSRGFGFGSRFGSPSSTWPGAGQAA